MSRLPAGALLASLVLVGCEGSIVGAGATALPTSPALPPSNGEMLEPSLERSAPARVRRLTAIEIRNSVSDVFPAAAGVSDPFPREAQRHKFSNQFDQLGTSLAVVEALQAYAESVAHAILPELPALFPCAEAGGAEASCAERFVRDMGLRLYRRPVAADEAQRLAKVFDAARQLGDYAEALATVVEAMLQSPYFLFRSELGQVGAVASERARLTDFEVASALSYFLWQSGPDSVLLEAAVTGKLSTAEELQVQIGRLLSDVRARGSLRNFFLEWIETAGLDQGALSSAGHPEFTPELLASMKAEPAAFFDDLFWRDGGDFTELMTSARSVVDANVAALYGAPAAGTQAIELNPVQRAGFLTQPAFLTAHARPDGAFSPVFLGQFVRSKLLCEALPPPPNDVPPLSPETDAISSRQRFAAHSNNPACSGCHELMDPIGFGFERYDALGRYREVEHGSIALSGAGEVVGSDMAGAFVGPAELSRKAAASAQVRACFASHLLEFALGRSATDARSRRAGDEVALQQAINRWSAGDRLTELVTGLALSDALFFRDQSNLPIGGAP